MDDAFPGEVPAARIHSQLALHREDFVQRQIELSLKYLASSYFSNNKARPLFIQEKININENNSNCVSFRIWLVGQRCGEHSPWGRGEPY